MFKITFALYVSVIDNSPLHTTPGIAVIIIMKSYWKHLKFAYYIPDIRTSMQHS